MKLKNIVLFLLLMFLYLASNAQIYFDNLSKLGKIYSEDSKTLLSIYGEVDSSQNCIGGKLILIIGTDRYNKPVNVKCIKQSRPIGPWYRGNPLYDAYYRGHGSRYEFNVLIYKDFSENVKVIQRSKGNYKVLDTFMGKRIGWVRGYQLDTLETDSLHQDSLYKEELHIDETDSIPDNTKEEWWYDEKQNNEY